MVEALPYARELIAFNSVSMRSNAAISDFVERTLRALDFEIERLEYTDRTGQRKVNLVGRKGRGSGGLAYFAHTDVVPADDWLGPTPGPFSPESVAGRLYGRGACDMKGSLACMLAAAARCSAISLRAPLYVTCTADEEIGNVGAQHVARHSSLFRDMVNGAAHGVIGEPTQLDVVYAHKGAYGFRVISHGRAAHSSTRRGINANLAMIPFLQEMKQLHEETTRDPRWLDDEFDPPTVCWNIGISDSTRAVNVTPAQSVCTVFFRPMPRQQPQQLLERAREAAERGGLEFQPMYGHPPLYIDPHSAYVREVLMLAENSVPRTVSYGTDGMALTDLRQLVVLGPGDIAQAHTADEWIALEQLERGAAIFARLIQHYCG